MEKHLTSKEKSNAYRAIVNRFTLRHQQRDLLNALPLDAYRQIRQAAHRHDWTTVEAQLNQAGIIHSEAGNR